MAIKGKKKSQSRGSQARRRPAAAPRAIGPGRRKPPWYKTPQGRAGLVALVLVVLAVVAGFVLNARSDAAKLEDRQDALETYTGSVRAVLQNLTPPASDMLDVPINAGEFAELARLPRRAGEWEDQINAAIDQLVSLQPPPGAIYAHSLFEQSGQLYLTTARQWQIMADQPNKTRGELLAETTTLRDQANTLWVNATAILDQVRADLDMDPSGLRSPAQSPANSQPAPAPSIPTGGGGGGNGGGGNGGNGGNGGGGSNDGSG
ncbi:MAG TPA: hypothetical protein VIG64_09310 [Actinomycetota bacterium]|jgi:uncharacterized membrane protein YgcG